MDDESHIRLIDSHSERDGRHDHVDFFHKELVLILGTCLGIKSGMIWCSLYSVDIQQLGEFFDLFSAEAVDDA